MPKAAAAFRAAARRDAEAAAQLAALAAAPTVDTDGWTRLGVNEVPIVPHLPDGEDGSVVPTLAHGLGRVLEMPGLHLA